MKTNFDYTFKARQFSFRHPVISSISTQINFWVVAYLLFATVIHLFTQSITDGTDIQNIRQPLPFFISTFIIAIIFGTASGILEYYVFNKKTTGRSLGFVILSKGLFYALMMTILFGLMRFVFWNLITKATYYEDLDDNMTGRSWMFMYLTLLIYTLTMGLVISFINQMNNKFGPGVLVPILLGKYIKPKVEDRIIIFLDLKSSTTLAEKLGHIKYSELIRDCFNDINVISMEYQAEIYQYVGDEVVLSWLTKTMNNPINAIDFYFACENIFNSKLDYYLKEYELLPEFKAGIHIGQITAVEVGSVKREIAYHGDTMNVTARIQEKCNAFKSNILISETLESKIDWNDSLYKKQVFEAVNLKGRKEPITIYNITLASEENN